MKILPSNVDDINDIEKIGNEIYFKKDENEIEDKMPFSTFHEQAIVVTHTALDENNNAENNVLDIENENWKHVTSLTSTSTVLSTTNKPTTTSITSPSTYQNPFIRKTTPNSKENKLNENDTLRETIDKLENEISNDIIFERNESSQIQPSIFTEKLNKANLVIAKKPIEDDQRVKPTPPITYQNKNYKDNSVIKSNDIIDNYDDEADYSYEDFAVEYSGRTVVRQNKIRNHTSYQTSVFKRPLLQGFLATTGYPKFYIGESNCSWRISAPIGQRVRITVLDINLRCKFLIITYSIFTTWLQCL